MKKILLIGITFMLFIAACQKAAEREVTKQEINSFDECVKAGYPVGESYPRQCFAPGPNGKTFVEEVKKAAEVSDPAVDAVGSDIGDVDVVEKDLSADELSDLDAGLADIQNI